MLSRPRLSSVMSFHLSWKLLRRWWNATWQQKCFDLSLSSLHMPTISPPTPLLELPKPNTEPFQLDRARFPMDLEDQLSAHYLTGKRLRRLLLQKDSWVRRFLKCTRIFYVKKAAQETSESLQGLLPTRYGWRGYVSYVPETFFLRTCANFSSGSCIF